jgi:hypothetical protein
LAGIAAAVFDGSAPTTLTDAQKQCCALSASKPLAGGSTYTTPYASGHMKADGTCLEIPKLAGITIAEPRERYGAVVQCRTLAMYNEDPWEDVGCQAACMACTNCDLAVDLTGTTTTPAPGAGGATGSCGDTMKRFDALNECKPNAEGWANLDMDSLTGGYQHMKNGVAPLADTEIETKISLTFGTKDAHMDVDRWLHGGTVFPPCDEDECPTPDFQYQALNKRYFLPCKQYGGSGAYPSGFDGPRGWAAPQKTIRVTITRPADLTEFGGEWVQSFPKDSWANETNEYEPYTFNDFGSKIPLMEFRPTTEDEHGRKIVLDAQDFPQVNVYMKMDTDGDYEIRYGNPHISYDHVDGQPLGLGDDGSVLGNGAPKRWVAMEFKKSQLRVGSPWSNCAFSDGVGTETASDYSSVGTIIPVYLGNPALLIHEFKAVHKTLDDTFQTTGKLVKVKIILTIFTDEADSSQQLGGWTEGPEADGVAGWSAGDPPKQDMHCDRSWQEGTAKTAANGCQLAPYDKCYSAGEPCPLDHSVCKKEYCELQRWREIIKLYKSIGSHVQVLGLVETKKIDNDPANVDTYGLPIPRTEEEIKADMDAYLTRTGGADGIDGFYMNEAHGTKATVDELMVIMNSFKGSYPSLFNVFGHGEPLFDLTAPDHVGAPDVWVTLHQTRSGLGFWTPFSWFSNKASDTWGAIIWGVDTLDVVDMFELLIDRGYGYIYLHSEADYATSSSHLSKLITEMGKLSEQTRRLDEIREERRLSQLRGERPDERRLQAIDDSATTRPR